MLIYRVEHPESGLGPYRHDDSLPVSQELLRQRTYGKREPAYIYDRNHVCGFESRKDLGEWFYGKIKKLKRDGFVICTFEVPVWAVEFDQPGTQVVFDKRKAKKISQEA